MASQRPALAGELERRADAAVADSNGNGNGEGEPKPPTIYALINKQRDEIARVLPKHMDPDRLARVAITVMRQNPKLLECTPQSLLGALMLSAQLGLEPGPLGHCYFVPFWNAKIEWYDNENRKRKGAFEVTFIIGYTGLIRLARNSGELLSIEAREVYDKDDFTYVYGLEPQLRHKPFMGEAKDRGEIIAFYGVARFKDGGHYFTVMGKAEVDAHRARSKAKDNGPWVTDYVPMGRKTVVRAMRPFLPLSIEAAVAIERDDTVIPSIEALAELPEPDPSTREQPAGDEQPDAAAPDGAATDDQANAGTDQQQPSGAAPEENAHPTLETPTE